MTSDNRVCTRNGAAPVADSKSRFLNQNPCLGHRCDRCLICLGGRCCGSDGKAIPRRRPKSVPANRLSLAQQRVLGAVSNDWRSTPEISEIAGMKAGVTLSALYTRRFVDRRQIETGRLPLEWRLETV